jgi:Trypsin
MPIPDEVRKSVLFIGSRESGEFRPRATGFLCVWHEDGFNVQYLITAEHVVSGMMTRGWDIWASANMKNGDLAEFRLPHDQFYFHPDETQKTDVAVFHLSDTLKAQDTGETIQMDVRAHSLNGPRSVMLTPELVTELQVGVGDEIAIIGLFRSHHGKEQNIPIARMGHIACMRHEPVFTAYGGYIDAYLIEARSISGLSGSPVFFINGVRVIKSGPERVTYSLAPDKPYYLLMGLVHGHFDIRNLNEDTVVEDEREATHGINTGIGVVIPVDKVVETIRGHPDLIQRRKEAVETAKKTQGKVTARLDENGGS